MSRGTRALTTALALLAAAGALPVPPAFAQDTRAGLIEKAQAEKAANPPIRLATAPEKVTAEIQQFFTPKESSFYPRMASVYGGGGFTLGLGYMQLYGDRASWRLGGLYSVKNYKLIDLTTLSPGHFGGRVDLQATAGWRDATHVGFYGLGMDTDEEDRANYRFQEFFASVEAHARPGAWTRLDGVVGLEDYRLLPGKGEEPSIEEAYTPDTAPGLGTSPTYVHSQATAAIDWRTSPGYSRTGGYYGVTLHDYTDTDGPYDFRRLDGTIVQHVPILRETWVVSLRGAVRTTLGDEPVPYFLLPSLGSSTTLRAYHTGRFRDRHSLVMSGEWRWIPSRLGMDMAIFYDAGKVASRREDLNLVGLAHDWGMGVRLHTPSAMPIRVELSRGSEGFHLTFASATPF
jgi:hypothetical protein